MYGVTLLGIRVLLYALDLYCRREHLYSPGVLEETADVRRTIAPVVVIYVMAILIGLALPVVAVGLYCAIAVFLVVPLRQLARTALRSCQLSCHPRPDRNHGARALCWNRSGASDAAHELNVTRSIRR